MHDSLQVFQQVQEFSCICITIHHASWHQTQAGLVPRKKKNQTLPSSAAQTTPGTTGPADLHLNHMREFEWN